ncbi:hypothetical protein ACJJTC_010514 [Scirpophaga incertulas]
MLPPKLNPEIVAAVSEPVKKRDLIIAERQKQVGAALAALGMSLQLFLQNGERIEILKNINDAAKILCNTFYSDTMSRRSLISAVINKDMKESLTGDTDSFLFGSDLSEKIKLTKAAQKSVKDLRINASNKPTITPKTKSLNWRAPPRSSARTVTGGRQNLPKQHQKEDRKHRQPFRNIHNNKIYHFQRITNFSNSICRTADEYIAYEKKLREEKEDKLKQKEIRKQDREHIAKEKIKAKNIVKKKQTEVIQFQIKLMNLVLREQQQKIEKVKHQT